MINLRLTELLFHHVLSCCAFRTRKAIIALILAITGIVGFSAFLFCPCQAIAQAKPGVPRNDGRASAIVVGFLGGFVQSDDHRHIEVQMAEQLREIYGTSAHVQVFENRHKTRAYKSIVSWLDSNGDGILSDEEKQGVPIVLFGHSWGASVMISLSRDLQATGIPVSLTIQVDSVIKNGENDSLIPANVAEAVNFYQSRGILHGCSKIRAVDPSRTRILGNFRFQYDKTPTGCKAFPWYDRVFSKGHIAIECDPLVWSQVEALIRTHIQSGAGAGAELNLGDGNVQGKRRDSANFR